MSYGCDRPDFRNNQGRRSSQCGNFCNQGTVRPEIHRKWICISCSWYFSPQTFCCVCSTVWYVNFIVLFTAWFKNPAYRWPVILVRTMRLNFRTTASLRTPAEPGRRPTGKGRQRRSSEKTRMLLPRSVWLLLFSCTIKCTFCCTWYSFSLWQRVTKY